MPETTRGLIEKSRIAGFRMLIVDYAQKGGWHFCAKVPATFFAETRQD
jgi:hypothetical protein